MILRTVKAEEYEMLKKELPVKAHVDPMDVCYTVNMQVSGVSYAIKMVFAGRCKVAVLQACRIDRSHTGQDRLITDSGLLVAFLEILLYQGIR